MCGPASDSEMLILAMLGIGFSIQAVAGLSFLGLALPPRTPTWGGAISDGIPYLLTNPLYSYHARIGNIGCGVRVQSLRRWTARPLDP